jgi:glycosyltransferase involved in cell wall biosynthesis
MLAIVIPYFKIDFFEETLQSLANQTDKRFHVYIGNDNSPSDPKPVLQKFEDNLNVTYKRFNTNLGSISLVQQWNRCLALVQDEQYIMILGDDDIISNNFVESFYLNLALFQNKYAVIRFATYKIDKFGKIFSELHSNPQLEESLKIITEKKRSSLSEYIFHKTKIKEIGFKNFPLGWYSDVLAVLEFSDFKVLFSINEAFVKIRISDSSISGKNSNLKQKLEAKFLFYQYLYRSIEHLKTENVNRLILTDNWSKIYINDKKQIKRLKIIIINYLRRKDLKALLRLVQLIWISKKSRKL